MIGHHRDGIHSEWSRAPHVGEYLPQQIDVLDEQPMPALKRATVKKNVPPGMNART